MRQQDLRHKIRQRKKTKQNKKHNNFVPVFEISGTPSQEYQESDAYKSGMQHWLR
ncbi:hypothetical protein JRQ81_016093 [Phrynocephalus forsythii]|uniref:Uncharacterized protein n=1 Tax=Phrynocephalus forsythii TaxID=171643 RepID=A0A9Q0XW76_9SAUR|nr:hypothetical protein JRQ81_016093 [Phrynocephalus forsythii]